jgi:hypothetical protein
MAWRDGHARCEPKAAAEFNGAWPARGIGAAGAGMREAVREIEREALGTEPDGAAGGVAAVVALVDVEDGTVERVLYSRKVLGAVRRAHCNRGENNVGGGEG